MKIIILIFKLICNNYLIINSLKTNDWKLILILNKHHNILFINWYLSILLIEFKISLPFTKDFINKLYI